MNTKHVARHETLHHDVHREFQGPVIFSICFSLICKTALAVAAIVISQDQFYAYYYLPVLFLEFIFHIIVLAPPFKSRQWTYDDFDFITAVDMWFRCGACFRTVRDSNLPVATWRVTVFWTFFAGVLVWLYPLGLYTSALGLNTGFGVSLAGKSSCQRNALAKAVFNPQGAFPFGDIGSLDPSLSVYTFCPLDQRWAYPNPRENIVRTYTYYPASFLVNCANPTSLAYIGLCPDAFPDPSLGVDGPIVVGTDYQSITFCPGNTPLPACYNRYYEPIDCIYCVQASPTRCFNIRNEQISCNLCTAFTVPGRPLKLCPVCLNYYRSMSGDHLGPGDEYAHCPVYNPNEAMNVFCYFCPGRGYGWHPDAVYDLGNLSTVFWIMTTSTLFVPFVDFLIFVFWVRDIRKRYFKVKKSQG